MKARLALCLVHHTPTMGYDPKATGLAERCVGLINEPTRMLLCSAELEPIYWPWAAEHAADQARCKVLHPGLPHGTIRDEMRCQTPVH